MATSKKTTTVTTSTAINVSGIDIDGIPKITSALNKYQEALKKAITTMTTEDEKIAQAAFKGKDAHTTFKQANASVKQSLVTVVNKLSNFQSALDKQVRANYNSGVQDAAGRSFKTMSIK